MNRTFKTLTASLLLLGATACSTGSTDATDGTPGATTTTKAEANAFPVTIEHAFGATTIEEEPVRVATVGWTDQDHVLALGVVPVGATKITWGGNADGSSDWFDAKLEEIGGEAPVRYDDTDGLPIDEIAKLEPDVVLATNSGLTQADYDKLSKFTKVVAFPEHPWVTDWQDSLEMVGEALGREEQAETLEDQVEAQIDQAKSDNPQLEDKELIYGYLTPTDLSQIGIYSEEDPRVALWDDFGLEDAESVDGIVEDGQFYGMVSAERANELTSDVFFTWVENEADVETITSDRLLGQIPAVKSGNAYFESDKQLASASTNPTPLSIPVIISDVLPKVVKAIDGN
jgi:iron complex transport system substrate-binding protein